MSIADPSAMNRRRLMTSLAATGALGAATLAGSEAKGATGVTESGSVAWTQAHNNNHVLELQAAGAGPSTGEVTVEYWGHCAIKITSPKGFSMIFDPWRNDPSGYWGIWFPNDFSKPVVDAGFSTHAHFDHDAINLVQATMLLDRVPGVFQFTDVTVTGVADKHACEAPGWYPWTNAIKEFGGDPCPPNNPGHMDMVTYVVETGGIRILIWGDNRHNPPDDVWQRWGRIDVLTLPVDGSQHILSYDQANGIVARLKPKVVIPTHYLCEGTSLTLSTLQPADEWVNAQKSKKKLDGATLKLNAADVAKMNGEFLYFGNNVMKT
ncbi:MAG: Zn-dependent hydrolase [Rhizobiales bacterium]|nr:Zn-dependent hydrolase [Hyphomicrobiales bacterium]